jgi:hypothetical protein
MFDRLIIYKWLISHSYVRLPEDISQKYVEKYDDKSEYMMPGHSSEYTSEEFKHICSITTVRCVSEDMSE